MDYIEIQGYKSIRDQRVDMKPINILIGSNGSGKSNFLSFFDFLSQLYNRNINEYIQLSGGADKILFNGRKETESIKFKLSFGHGTNGYSATLTSGDEGFIFIDENLYYNDRGWSISNFQNEARVKIHKQGKRGNYIRNYLNGLRKYHFHDTSKNSPFTKTSSIENDIYHLYGDGSNLAAFLYNINQENTIVYNRIIKTIQSIAPFFLDFYFQPNSENLIRLQWKDKYSETIYGATDLSDGTIRFIALTVLFMQPKLPDTIIIDEPELGLHPFAIAKLAGMIKSVSESNCQVIAATQSTDLLSYFMPEDIITVDQMDGETQFQRLNSEALNNWLDDYTIDDLWKRNIIQGGQPNR